MMNSIPSWLTRGLDEEKKKYVETQYNNSKYILKLFRKHYEHKLEGLYKASEELLTHEEYIYNASKRSLLRELLRAFPEDTNKEQQ